MFERIMRFVTDIYIYNIEKMYCRLTIDPNVYAVDVFCIKASFFLNKKKVAMYGECVGGLHHTQQSKNQTNKWTYFVEL